MAAIGTWLAQQLMRDFGLSPAAAAGFAGNLAHESGDFKVMQERKPVVPGSRGGFGWAQWTGPRRKQFEQYVTSQGLDPTSPEANYGFLKHELTNTPERAVLAKLQNVNDPTQAAEVVSNTFLRPGIPHMDSRKARAQSIAQAMGSIGPEAQSFVNNNPQPGGFGPGISDPNAPQPPPAPSMDQPFGTMAPMMASAPIPSAVADYANSKDPKPFGERLAGAMSALSQTPEPPRISGGMGDARATGNALLEFLASPTAAEILMKKRMRGVA